MAGALILRLTSRNEQGEENTNFELVKSCDKLKRPTPVELSLSGVSKYLICAICDKIMRDPCFAAPCGDLFCRICLRHLLKKLLPPCPSCGEPLENRISGSRQIREELDELKFSCENGVAFDIQQNKFVHLKGVANSCPEVLPLSHLESHIESCRFTPSVCPNREDGCPLIAPKFSLELHKVNCRFRFEICRCGEKVSTVEYSEHKSSCQVEEISCPYSYLGCSSRVQRWNLNGHIEMCHYKAAAKSAVNEAYVCAVEKVASMALGSLEMKVPWEELMIQSENEAREKLTKCVQPELREEWGGMLVERLRGTHYFELLKKAHSRKETVTSTPSAENQILFTAMDIKKITRDFSIPLGEGGFGNVYLGDFDGTLVAVKKLKGGKVQDFKHELEVLSRLRHPNIVLLMGFCPEERCIVSEFLEGGDLKERLEMKKVGRKLPLTWKDRVRIFLEISSALLYLHKRGIFHRDLKPANILLTESNSSRLADMGLAKHMDTPISYQKGTVGYMDPCQGNKGFYTAASDVYSLGVIMFQFLFGVIDVRKVTAIRHKYLESSTNKAVDYRNLLARLDRQAGSWDMEMAGRLIALSLKCMKSTLDDRPDLEREIIPELMMIQSSGMEDSPRRAIFLQSISSGDKGLTTSDDEGTSATPFLPESSSFVGRSELFLASDSLKTSGWTLQSGDDIDDSVVIPAKPHYVPRIPLMSIIDAVKKCNDRTKLGIARHNSTFQQCVGPNGTAWTVCRANSVTTTSWPDFEKEVDTLSKISHQNVVKLLGYCDTKQEQILLFESINGRNLKDKLATTGDDFSNPLTFLERVEIALGAAEGLKYFHEEIGPHGNITSENIFLNLTPQGFQAKIGNFESQKDVGNESSSTSKKHSGLKDGYIDPEYHVGWKFTRKSDVYSFGVVLFELITGLPAVLKDVTSIDAYDRKTTMLINLVRQNQDFTTIVDKRLQRGNYSLEAMKDLVMLAADCTKRSGRDRPVIEMICDSIRDIAGKGGARFTR